MTIDSGADVYQGIRDLTVSLDGGVLTVTVQLPDNLTSFRVMAVMITATDRFGSGETAVQVNKPVMALPAMPRARPRVQRRSGR